MCTSVCAPCVRANTSEVSIAPRAIFLRVTSERVFYSWQSDLPNSINRGLIGDVLKRTCKLTSAELEIALRPDQGAEGLSGAPDIREAIFRKIEKSRVFVADVTPINVSPDALVQRTLRIGYDSVRPTPNPNVMMEVGYAVHAIGWSESSSFRTVRTGQHRRTCRSISVANSGQPSITQTAATAP